MRHQPILPKIPLPQDAVLRLKISISDTRPPIWRRIDVPNTYTFHQLHHLIQIAFDWTNSHLYEFFNASETIGDYEATQRAEKITLKERLYEPKQKIDYVYDFGDNWEHCIELEKILPLDTPAPGFITGRRAAPPEDVGGWGGYEDFVKIMADPSHPAYEEFEEWNAGPFDAAFFDKKEIKELFAEYADGKLDLDSMWEED